MSDDVEPQIDDHVAAERFGEREEALVLARSGSEVLVAWFSDCQREWLFLEEVEVVDGATRGKRRRSRGR